MCVQRSIFIAILLQVSTTGCQEREHTDTASLTELASHYVSIDGLWKCTPETSLKFPNGTLEPVIRISGAANHNLSVRGCFLWDGRYYDEWELVDIQFDDYTNQLRIIDGNNSTYVGLVDPDLRSITGIVYAGDPDNEDQEDSLNFSRVDANLAERLFYPRLPETDGSISYTYLKPGQFGDGLQTASVFDFMDDKDAFLDLMARIIRQEYGRLESLLVIKDGNLVIEEYYYGYSPLEMHNIHSCTKSITSLLLGIALENHPGLGVDQPVFSFFPQYDSLRSDEKDQITLEHILTMTSGIEEEEVEPEAQFDNQLHYILSKPLASKPGEKFRYWNSGSDLLGWIIHSLEGKHADQYARDQLFAPLGITEYYWEFEDGTSHCHSDLYLLPRDMAKIGLMVLNNGKWQGQKIVPEMWIEESTRPRVAESKYYDYGYQWWHRSRENVAWWKEGDTRLENEYDKIIALGYGGQYIMVVRDINLVIVTNASDYADGAKARSKVKMAVEEIVPLFENRKEITY